MNPLWFLDGTFWEKMYFVTMVIGVAIFVNFLFDIIPDVKKRFREFIPIAKKECRKQIVESKKIIGGWKMKKGIGIGIAIVMICGLFSAIGISENATATKTGDIYSGSGDWTISNPTVYTNEIFSVYGNISIAAGGSLSMVSSEMTIRNTAPYSYINISFGAPNAFLSLTDSSQIDIIDFTYGVPKLVVDANGESTNAGYFYIEDSEIYNTHFSVDTSAICTIKDSTLVACQARCYSSGGAPSTIPLYMSNNEIKDVNTVSQPNGDLRSVITMSSGTTITGNTFENITLNSRSTLSNSYIRANGQNSLTITNNDFGDSTYPVICIQTTTYDTNDCVISGNDFNTIGNTKATASYAVYLDGYGYDSTFYNNNYDYILNGSYGVYHDGYGWTISSNHFGILDATEDNTTVTHGIHVNRDGLQAYPCLITGNDFDDIIGPDEDVGGHAMGIVIQNAGNVTVSYNEFASVGNAANAIAVLGPQYHNCPYILITRNTINNVHNLSNGIYLAYGYATVSYNNIDGVDGSCSGIMIHGPEIVSYVYWNRVTGLYDSINEWPIWQISVGAYCIVANQIDSVLEMPEFRENYAEGATAIHPDYDICGSVLGGGHANNVTARIDIPAGNSSIIRTIHANLSLENDCGIYYTEIDGTQEYMKHYPSGMSYSWIPNLEAEYMYVNVTSYAMRVIPSTMIEVLAIDSMSWISTSSSDVTIEISGVPVKVPGLTSVAYEVFQDDISLGYYGINDETSFSFETNGTGTFEIEMVMNPYVKPFANVMIFLIIIGVAAAIIMVILKIKDTGQIFGE